MATRRFRHAHVVVFGGVVVFVVAFLMLCTLAAMLLDESSRDRAEMVLWPRHFSVEAWREHPRQRHLMALDLVESGTLRGKSRSWLKTTLGSPDGEGSAGIHWNVPSPQRPDDQLVVELDEGVVGRAVVTDDPF